MIKLPRKLFITGIGTEVGKTVTSSVFVQAWKADYFKPIQSGDLDYSDSMKVEKFAPDHGKIWPEGIRLQYPLSPHESARLSGVDIQMDAFKLPETDGPLIVEGAGGLMVPITETQMMPELIKKFDLPVVLVVRHYLGSINHTMLSLAFLEQHKIPLAAVVISGEAVESSERFIRKHTGSAPWLRIPEHTPSAEETVKVASDWNTQIEYI